MTLVKSLVNLTCFYYLLFCHLLSDFCFVVVGLAFLSCLELLFAFFVLSFLFTGVLRVLIVVVFSVFLCCIILRLFSVKQ